MESSFQGRTIEKFTEYREGMKQQWCEHKYIRSQGQIIKCILLFWGVYGSQFVNLPITNILY